MKDCKICRETMEMERSWVAKDICHSCAHEELDRMKYVVKGLEDKLETFVMLVNGMEEERGKMEKLMRRGVCIESWSVLDVWLNWQRDALEAFPNLKKQNET